MNAAGTKAPWHLWAVGALTLLWNAVGVTSYSMTELGKLEALGMTPDQIAYFDSFPAWAIGLWALGVWGAFFGSVLLLLRSRFAAHALTISVVGLIGTTYFQRIATTLPANMQNTALDAAIWAITLFTLWYAMRQRRAGVLR